MTSAQFSWFCCNKKQEKRKVLENLLPSMYKYNISSFKIVEESDIEIETKFEAVIGVNV